MERKETIIDLLDDIEDAIEHNPELEVIIRQGLEIIINKIKETENKKWRNK